VPDAAVAAGVAPAPPLHEAVPRVIRRILAEQRELVDRSFELAAELPDPKGRARAEGEARALADELVRLTAPLDTADSSQLDETVTRLILLDTKIALLHESLRTATNRTSALGSE
jgi:hypothetical protein